MKVSTGNITPSFLPCLRITAVLVLFLAFSLPSAAQNTKGDRPNSAREGRFKTQKRERKGTKIFSKRIKSKGRTPANSGSQYRPRRGSRGGEQVGKRLKPVFNVKDPGRKDRQRPWKGDIAGRPLRQKNQSSTTPYVHPQRGKYVRRTVPEREGRRNVTAGRRTRVQSATGSVRNVYPQRGKFVNNPSSRPRDTQRAVSNRSQLARTKALEARKPPSRRKVRVIPRSASRPFIRNKSINVYANFKRPKRKGEQATTKDLAGRRLRTRNYKTPSPGFIKAPRVNTDRKRMGDRPYRGPSGSYRSASGKQNRPWKGDITGRAIRSRSGKQQGRIGGMFSRNRSATKTGVAGQGGGYRSRSGGKRVGVPLPVRAPGIGARGIGNYRGDRRGLRGFRNQGEGFSGVLRSSRRLKGGGSVSGRRWNNNGNAIPVRSGKVNSSGIPIKRRLGGGFVNQGENYTGGIKRGRPARGGGSVSGRLWNNNGNAIPARGGKVNTSGIPGKQKLYPRGFNNQGEEYSGAIKSRRPAKGGGSVSGKLWNNEERPLEGKFRSQRGLDFSGNIRTKRPEKGGGSVSGRLWNNKETPIPGRSFPAKAKAIEGFPGKMRRFENQPGFANQGEEFTGNIRLKRLRRNYVQNEHANDESIKKRKPAKEVYGVEGLQVKVRRPDYVRNKNIAEDALLKKKTTDTDRDVAGLQVKVKRRQYVRNKNAAEESLLKLKPTRSDAQVADLQVKVKSFRYVRNPSSAEGALKVREPGKAFARAVDYQGNIRMKKYKFFERNRGLHPDAQFVRTNRNNVDDERDTLTNFKLWWARLFKKQDNQPEHLKRKEQKPRYDKGEEGLWYD